MEPDQGLQDLVSVFFADAFAVVGRARHHALVHGLAGDPDDWRRHVEAAVGGVLDQVLQRDQICTGFAVNTKSVHWTEAPALLSPCFRSVVTFCTNIRAGDSDPPMEANPSKSSTMASIRLAVEPMIDRYSPGLSFIRHYYVNKRQRDAMELVNNLLLPGIRFPLTLWLWTSLSATSFTLGLALAAEPAAGAA